MASSFHDDLLGTIIVRRHHNASGVKLRVSPKGELIATAAPHTPMLFIRQTVRMHRRQLKAMRDSQESNTRYEHGQTIGQSHSLQIISDPSATEITVRRHQRTITATIPAATDSSAPAVQTAIQAEVIKALRREAKAYAGRRVAILATRHNFQYQKIRYTHAGTRWGSCSSSGTISLNIALMKLPLELIDYVIIHELCHTRQMNHSSQFWQLVEEIDPEYRTHRRALKAYSPAL